MLPLMIIGGVIGAVMSVAKGASWVSDQVNASKTAASAGGKDSAASATDAKSASFDQTLAAQAAGQSVPPAVAPSVPTVVAPTPIPHMQPTDYDSVARTKAGIEAYSQVGERHHNHNNGAGAISDTAAKQS
jgi:hypothetical protein